MKLGDYVFNWYKIPEVESMGAIAQSSVLKLFKDCYIKLSDNGYDIIRDEDMWRTILLNRFVEKEYVKRKRDCDDFAIALLGHVRKLVPGAAFGMMWVDIKDYKGKTLYKHALNFFINEKREIVPVEPQTNEIFIGRYEPYFVLL